mmetsp:Transcript_9712/g.24407  ORF Transcript_9712/g.24407 Transcript_9712/m.24407 type:complete len:165 (-) Transcript_9712:313-807(-)
MCFRGSPGSATPRSIFWIDWGSRHRKPRRCELRGGLRARVLFAGKRDVLRGSVLIVSVPNPGFRRARFDDDNDIELGELCGRAYLPGITHDSVAAAAARNPHWTVTKNQGVLGTEEALEALVALRESQLAAAAAPPPAAPSAPQKQAPPEPAHAAADEHIAWQW